MIPTFRSMAVATVLSLMALVGGFGLFAAFRVNHEPLARLPTSATTFALANNDGSPHALSFASEPPFGSRLENNAAVIAINAASTAEPNPGSANTVGQPNVAAAPDSSADNTPVATAAVDAKIDDAPPNTSTAADSATVDVSPPAAIAEVEPKADDAPPPAAMAQSQAASVEPSQPDTIAQPAAQTAMIEPPGNAQPSDQAPGDQANNQASVTAPETEKSQPEAIPPEAASPIASAPIRTVALTPAVTVKAEADDSQVSAREIARRRRLAAMRRARRARALAAAQLASQNNPFPPTNFTTTSQIDFQPAQQQAVGGPFVPVPAKARRLN
jgi:hypothetical protein